MKWVLIGLIKIYRKFISPRLQKAVMIQSRKKPRR